MYRERTHKHKQSARDTHTHKADTHSHTAQLQGHISRDTHVCTRIQIYALLTCKNVLTHTQTHKRAHIDLLCTHTETSTHRTYATDLVSHSQIHNSRLTMADPGDMFCVSKDI